MTLDERALLLYVAASLQPQLKGDAVTQMGVLIQSVQERQRIELTTEQEWMNARGYITDAED
jgi:hypothetical protein